MTRGTHALLVALLVTAGLSATACGPRLAHLNGAPADSGGSSWSTSLDRDHPLVGRVWDVHRGVFVSPDTMVANLEGARFVLLGEKHDNPDHHRLQAEVLAALAAGNRKPAVAFEMIDVNEQPKVDRYREGPAATPAGLGSALGWEGSGWPPYPQYLPIFEVAFRRQLPIVGANLPHDEVRAIVHEGLAALPAGDVARLALDRPMPPALDASLREELAASHCGHLPEAMTAPMALAQRARDGQMADVLLSAGRERGAILIAGAGHARRDRGVPWVLGLRSETSVSAVAFIEVERGKNDPAAYGDRFGAAAPPFDYVWFTPRANDDDPCAAFRK